MSVDQVLVDTCILLDDPDVLMRIRQRGGLPFLTSTVLDELDFKKSGDAEINRNARMIFREFNRGAVTKLSAMPTGGELLQADVLTQFPYRDGPVFLVAREHFRSQSNNDGKIIELAKDYRMVLITRDAGMKVRAEALGVRVAFWTGPDVRGQRRPGQDNQRRDPPHAARPQRPARQAGPTPFAVQSSPVGEEDTLLHVARIPAAGDVVRLAGGHEFRLGELISAGGEGSIYETQLAGQVCKVYHRHRLTKLKERKIELMVSRRLERPGICWPTEIVSTAAGEFVGYLMPRATGTTMQTALFVKPRLEKIFPDWTRQDLVNVAGTFVDHVAYLHSLNIIVGDINPLNLLVTADSTKVWMVDTDSFQIENFPCPVGTVNFTPPEIQGQNYSSFLRTKEHELFAVATMIFMILFPGKPPYSQQGGGSPVDNIKLKNFPYPFFRNRTKENTVRTATIAPQGTWQFIWGNLPQLFRDALFSTFREGRRVTVEEWAGLLRDYRDGLQARVLTNELFPLGFKPNDPVQLNCPRCSQSFVTSQRWVDKLTAEKKPVWCPVCANRVRLERMAAQSRQTTEQVTGRPQARSSGARSSQTSTASRPTSHRPPPSSAPKRQPTRSSPTPQSSSSVIGAILRFIFK